MRIQVTEESSSVGALLGAMIFSFSFQKILQADYDCHAPKGCQETTQRHGILPISRPLATGIHQVVCITY